ncbi:MAG: Clp protease N-terminal domain-containing protein, partial [Hyphomicrobium sp.]
MLARNLEQTLHLALELAHGRRHEFATLEHLLLALTEDADAIAVMRACDVNIDKLRTEITTYLDDELGELVAPEDNIDPKPTDAFQRVLQR